MTMKIALEKLSKIEEEVINTRIDVAKIEQHLKTLNGNVQRNRDDIKCNQNDIKKIRNQQIKLAATVGALVAILTVVANWVFGTIL